MKGLRCIVAIVLCLSLFLAVTPVRTAATELKESPTAKQAEATAELKEFAAETVLPFIKGWLKSSGAIGRDFASIEEIDKLQVGAIFRPYYFKEGTEFDKIALLSEAIDTSDKWMMLVCTPEGEVKWYAVIAEKEDGQGYKFSREGCAVGLGQALEVFENINRGKNREIDPTVIWYTPYEMIVMEVIDGEEAVITVGETLDHSYARITDPQYLPTGMDAIRALHDASTRLAADDTYGDVGSLWLTASEQPSAPKAALETWHILLMTGGVCVIVAAAACLVIVGKRKARS